MLTLENADSSWEVVNATCGLEGSDNDRWCWDKIVGESVVQVALHRTISRYPAHVRFWSSRTPNCTNLQLKDILNLLELLLKSITCYISPLFEPMAVVIVCAFWPRL